MEQGFLEGVVWLSQEQYDELKLNGTITVDGVTHTYSEDVLYITPTTADLVNQVQDHEARIETNEENILSLNTRVETLESFGGGSDETSIVLQKKTFSTISELLDFVQNYRDRINKIVLKANDGSSGMWLRTQRVLTVTDTDGQLSLTEENVDYSFFYSGNTYEFFPQSPTASYYYDFMRQKWIYIDSGSFSGGTDGRIYSASNFSIALAILGSPVPTSAIDIANSYVEIYV